MKIKSVLKTVKYNLNIFRTVVDPTDPPSPLKKTFLSEKKIEAGISLMDFQNPTLGTYDRTPHPF